MSLPKTQQLRPLLSLHQATFRLGDRLVFENTSWVFRRHEHWAILGPNGSGKSLFADALRGQVPLVGGELRYHWMPPPGLGHEDAIGHVSFEDRKQEVHETLAQSRWNSLEEQSTLPVGQFLSFERVLEINPFEVRDGQKQRRTAFERRRRRAVALLGIQPFLGHSLLSLSNGETQRVQLARALCRPLRLLILDEPFLGLDTATRGYLHKVLERLMQTSLRVLLVTTRPEDLPRGITHVLQVEDCSVVSTGPRRGRRVGQAFQPAGEGGFPAARFPGRTRSSDRGAGKPPSPAAWKGCPTQPLIRMRKVTVRYGATTILRELDWTVWAGESWALLGPNGSGKTTLLSLILGDNPQAYMNEVEVFGRRRGSGDSIWDIKRHIGWVSPELHVHFNTASTCLEVVVSGFRDTVGLFQPASSRQRRAAREHLAQFGLLDLAATPLFALSAGHQRMVLLARALVKRPRLLVLDEPCQGLDQAHRELFILTVDGLLRKGTVTAIYVTHRADEIPAAIRRVLRLRKESF